MTMTFGGTGGSSISGAGLSQSGEWWVMILGDSKSALPSTVTSWPGPLAIEGAARTHRIWSWADGAVGGRTVATTVANLTATLAAMPAATGAIDVRVLVNLGVNDITSGLPSQAAWTADYLTILDAIHAKWPTARVYLTRPWLIGNPSPSYDAQSDTLATWIAAIVAARPTFANLGDDERIWLKGADNGATNTVDGTHYNAAGNVAATTAKAAILWT